jgi:type II secretory pathway pseudopilin PulG
MIAKQTNSAQAFTLLESLLASSLLATAVVGIVVPFVAGEQNQRDDSRRTIATNLAQELMEEILTKTFNDQGVGPESGETSRSQYNCINDYNNYTESAGHILDNCGNTVTDPATVGLSRNVSVSYVTVPGQTPVTPPIFACVIVEVKYDGNSLLKLTRLVYSQP